MAFRVELAPQAFDDLDAIASYISEHSRFAIRSTSDTQIRNRVNTPSHIESAQQL